MRRREALLTAAGIFGLAPAVAKAALEVPPLPDEKLFARDPENYWLKLRREQFLLPEGRAFLNVGSLGVAAKPALAATFNYLTQSASLEGLTSDGLPRWGGETFDDWRQELADFAGCKKDELALTRNTTDGMNTVCQGLDLKAGDEVLITDQEHPGGTFPWMQKQARFGVQVRRAEIPIPPASPAEIADRVISAIGPRTRILSFSGITTTTGLVTPIQEICAAARAKGVLTLIDGAHMNGQVPVNLHELGCDFFAGSPHKWMFTPCGCGLLYIREEHLEKLWVHTATFNWDKYDLKAARFMMVGTNNRAIFEGHMAALRFLKQLGPDRAYGRIHQLARGVRERLARLPQIELLTPADDRLYAGMVSFQFKGIDPKPLYELARKRGIWIAGSERLRISTHVHTRPADLDAFFQTMHESLGIG